MKESYIRVAVWKLKKWSTRYIKYEARNMIRGTWYAFNIQNFRMIVFFKKDRRQQFCNNTITTLSTLSLYFRYFVTHFAKRTCKFAVHWISEGTRKCAFSEQNETINDRCILHARLPAKVDKNLFPIFTLEWNWQSKLKSFRKKPVRDVEIERERERKNGSHDAVQPHKSSVARKVFLTDPALLIGPRTSNEFLQKRW